MSMYLQLVDVCEKSAPPKPVSFSAKNAENKGDTLTVKMEGAPAGYGDDAMIECAKAHGVTPTRTIKLPTGATEKRPLGTVAGEKAVGILRMVRGIKIAEAQNADKSADKREPVKNAV